MTTEVDERMRQRELLRHEQGSHMAVETAPDAHGMGAESAEYIRPTIDPQWIPAWKMFVDDEGEYGVPVKLPRGQWSVGGPNALENLRRPDGGFWFRLATPERVQPDAQYECFVGSCTKKLHRRIQVVGHVRAFHHDEAEAHKAILTRIEQQVASEDPRLQRLLESLGETIACEACGETPPPDHKAPKAWLRGHKVGAHKDGSD